MEKIKNPSLTSFVKMTEANQIDAILRVRNRLSKRVNNIVKHADTNKATASNFKNLKPTTKRFDSDTQTYKYRNVSWSKLGQLSKAERTDLYNRLVDMDNAETSTVKGAKSVNDRMMQLVGRSDWNDMSDSDKSDFWRAFNKAKETHYGNVILPSEQILDFVSDESKLLGYSFTLEYDLDDDGNRKPILDKTGKQKKHVDGSPMYARKFAFYKNGQALSNAEVGDSMTGMYVDYAELPDDLKRDVKKRRNSGFVKISGIL